MKFYCIQQQRTIKQQGHGVAWWFGRASSPRTLFTLLKCPSEKHWISSSFSGAGLHHFSAFHPLQMGQAWKIMVHIHLFFFFNRSWQLVLLHFLFVLLSTILFDFPALWLLAYNLTHCWLWPQQNVCLWREFVYCEAFPHCLGGWQVVS